MTNHTLVYQYHNIASDNLLFSFVLNHSHPYIWTAQCTVHVTHRIIPKDVFHIISFKPIIERLTSKSFHEPSVKLVRTEAIGTFWWATTEKFNT